MRLDINAFRLIKPANAVDHYEAGNPLVLTGQASVHVKRVSLI